MVRKMVAHVESTVLLKRGTNHPPAMVTAFERGARNSRKRAFGAFSLKETMPMPNDQGTQDIPWLDNHLTSGAADGCFGGRTGVKLQHPRADNPILPPVAGRRIR
jgi:hypothetical protein